MTGGASHASGHASEARRCRDDLGKAAIARPGGVCDPNTSRSTARTTCPCVAGPPMYQKRENPWSGNRLDAHALAYAPEHTYFSKKKMSPQGGQRAAQRPPARACARSTVGAYGVDSQLPQGSGNDLVHSTPLTICQRESQAVGAFAACERDDRPTIRDRVPHRLPDGSGNRTGGGGVGRHRLRRDDLDKCAGRYPHAESGSGSARIR